jgi:hypothetical protein
MSTTPPVTKAEIEALTNSVGEHLPAWTRNPATPAEFFAAVILLTPATPLYDHQGVLVAMRGIGLSHP